MEPNSSTPPQPAAAATSTLLHPHFRQPTLTQHYSLPDHRHHQHCYYSYQNQSFAYPLNDFPATNAELLRSWLPGNSGLVGDFFPFLRRVNSTGQMLAQEQERTMRTTLDPYTSKAARIKRRIARQRSLCLSQNQTAGHPDSRRLNLPGPGSGALARRDLYKFITPDNKRLRVVLEKELRQSDVGSLGRIVLPKRAAEENLPSLVEKEGIQVVVREVSCDQNWAFKYKFWVNNRSRMYVLENTGEFVKQKQLGMGDSLTLYEDESKNLYVSVTKATKSPAGETRTNEHPKKHQHSDDEEASLALLIDQVLANHDEQAEAADPDNSIDLFPNGGTSSSRPASQQLSSPSTSRNYFLAEAGCWSTAVKATTVRPTSGGKERRSEDGASITFDDCYGGLDTLPDIIRYNFSP